MFLDFTVLKIVTFTRNCIFMQVQEFVPLDMCGGEQKNWGEGSVREGAGMVFLGPLAHLSPPQLASSINLQTIAKKSLRWI